MQCYVDWWTGTSISEELLSTLGPSSSVGIATGYGLDCPGIESRCGARFSAPVQTGPGTHPASCTMDIGSYPGVKSGRGVTLTPHPLLVPWLWKSRAIPVVPVWAVRPVQSLSACTVQLYLYSPYGPCGLYRASVPVQYSYTSTPPMGRTACTEPQCLYSTAITLLPSVPVQYSYTSTPPMGRTACTEPQCLYKGALYLYCLHKILPWSWRQQMPNSLCLSITLNVRANKKTWMLILTAASLSLGMRN